MAKSLKSSKKRKIVKNKDLKKRGNKSVKCDAQASLFNDTVDYVFNDLMLKKVETGEKTLYSDWYYGDQGQVMRLFDWSNSAFKILESLVTVEGGLAKYIKVKLPEQYKKLATTHELIIEKLAKAKDRCDDIRASIFYGHGKEFGIKYNEQTKEYYL
jgi:hypothetical protein